MAQPDATITQKYIRRYPTSKRTRSWAGRLVHIRTENGVWRVNGQGYTNAGDPDAWALPFEEAQKEVEHCGPEKRASFIAAKTPPFSNPLWTRASEARDAALARDPNDQLGALAAAFSVFPLMKVKPLRWSESEVFGAQKRRGHGIGGEFTSFNARGLSAEERAKKEAAAQADYEVWVQEHVLFYFQ